MNSNSQSANSTDTYSHRLADIVGTAIALLTLTLPVFVIAHYSSTNVQNSQPQLIYNLHRSQD
ncbi:MAG: YidC/Oxa1 family membrane protein insertase [Mojavia pulchra JT2-VF2]|uniref:YidC/Oxa1 family membrane protein insertase n=1 Tax=Mojavia pulchra JT2-VF2 TaxID=287848 RepID=A0A951PYQ3_9NOST|nr:YidC/Oxa1 family membrane protein insertase [Mojavia pulchra JT2-VF2]